MQQVNIAHWSGARVISVDLVQERLNVAKEMGADLVINAGEEDVVEAVKGVPHLPNKGVPCPIQRACP